MSLWHPRGVWALALPVLAACGAGCVGSPTSDVGVTRGAVTGGQPEPGHPEVAAIMELTPLCGAAAAPPRFTCTGTLIAPRVLLTAAHCVVDPAPPDLLVVFGPTADPAAITQARVVQKRLHPTFASPVDDVAILVLDREVTVTPAPLRTAPLDATAVGALVTVVGFGADDSGTAGTKRSGTSKITAVAAKTFDAMAAPASSCGGDSGGPLFYDDGAGAGSQLAGITGSGGPTCVQGTNLRVDAYQADFIGPALAELAAAPPPARPSLILTADACVATCQGDADCPVEQVCETGHCTFAGLAAGHFGEACLDACASGTCVSVAAQCRCWVPCNAPPPVAKACAVAPGERTAPRGGAAIWLAGVAMAATVLAKVRRRGRKHGRPGRA